MHPVCMARLVWLLLASSASFVAVGVVRGNMVLPVHHKFKGQGLSLSALKAHDLRRHGRFLFDVDLELGGNGLATGTGTGLYYAKIGIGSPSKNYYVQVDTGSDVLWVNCVGCGQCPTKTRLGVELTPYDLRSSTTSTSITCDQAFCTSNFNFSASACSLDLPCGVKMAYADGVASMYFVKDNIHLEQVTGNLQTAQASASVIFGCGTSVSGEFASSPVGGILGLGPGNTSLIAQLASAGEVNKAFAHCLNSVSGGGIFVIGQVVEPKVNTTPLVPNQEHYNVVLETIEVGGDVLNLTSNAADSGTIETIFDSGTTLAYLPEAVYNVLLSKITTSTDSLEESTGDGETCFIYSGNLDVFPMVTFYFEGFLSLAVSPQDYLLQVKENAWCVGWQNIGTLAGLGSEIILLGDLVLSNRLVFYDLENQTIGWTKYNCSSSSEVRLDSGLVYLVGAQNISSASFLIIGKRLISSLDYDHYISLPFALNSCYK